MNMLVDIKKICFFQEKTLLILFVLGSIFLFVSFGLILFGANSLTLPIILRFDNLRGIDMFGVVSDVWGIWFLGFSMAALNTILAQVFFFRERVLSYVFTGANVLISLLLIIIMSLIINVN